MLAGAPRGARPWPRAWSVPAIVGAALFIAAVAYFALRPRRSPEEIAKLIATAGSIAEKAEAKSAPATTPAPASPGVAPSRSSATSSR